MNKKGVILIIVFIISFVILIYQNGKLRDRIDLQLEQISITTEYIQYLTSIVSEQNKDVPEYNKQKRLSKILDDYIEEKKEEPKIHQDVTIDQLMEADYDKFEENDFIPDLIPILDEYAISQQFGTKHKGLDFAAEEGAEVVAAASGKVISNYIDKHYGNVVIIDHLNEYITAYAHLSEIYIQKNDFVDKGKYFADVGNTGNSSAPHLHFAIFKDSKSIDPESMLKD